MSIELLFYKYIEIFFAIIPQLLFIAFVFLTTHLNSKFFIFFISSFINIFCCSAIMNDQYNFLYIVLLNIIFMLVIIFYYILINTEEDVLSMDFIHRTTIRYVIIILSFLVSFISISIVFTAIVHRKDQLPVNKPSIVVLADKREKIRSKNKNIMIEKKTINSDGITNLIYEKRLTNKGIESFKYFNVIMYVYVIFLSVSYFIYKV